MELLKEDGSLDVEKINKLPREDFLRVIARFTREQMKEYISKTPVTHGPVKPIKVDYKMEDLLARGYATSEQILNMISNAIREHEKDK